MSTRILKVAHGVWLIFNDRVETGTVVLASAGLQYLLLWLDRDKNTGEFLNTNLHTVNLSCSIKGNT